MEIGELIGRIALTFFALFTLARIMGRKEISQITFFNFVSAIAIGSVAANLVVNANLSIRNGIIALIGWSLFTLIMDVIDIKSKLARKITTGDPVVVIKEGKIVENSLRKSRLDIDSLSAMLRQQNVFSMADVDYAIFETNGKLSVMKKENKQTVTKSDMNLLPNHDKKFPIATQVISDGILLTKNLSKLNISDDWVYSKLREAKIDSVENVFYAEVQQDGSLFIDKKQEKR
ncbi:YetF domain-containing protein [Aquibacillus salsiterrae]|uniref:DUF421 domain-containing protein n=1 Tax=Aquibacillus salsiterrae TaxID=2950439 RepID=A0A9X3WIE9_9BACI|nr:DUF421 domain-containing protein [Aquibacillus salsiterrae]MDC3417616.1 DUF421 domain-containing protein [Aquibacillus salsiterrae]